LQHAQVDQHVGQGVQVANPALVAQLGPLDTEINRLAVDPLTYRPLLEDALVLLAIAVELPTDTRAGAGYNRGRAAAAREGARCASAIGQGAPLGSGCCSRQTCLPTSAARGRHDARR
jgi:hypothetical protein